MNENSFPRLFRLLPILAFFAYWAYACLAGALLANDPRLVKLGVLTLPLLAAMAAAAVKAFRGGVKTDTTCPPYQ